MRIHFGYDYYLYIGSKNSCSATITQIESTGLFVEEHEEIHYKRTIIDKMHRLPIIGFELKEILFLSWGNMPAKE